MTTFTRERALALREDIIAALAAVGAKHGVTVECSGGSLAPDRFTAKIEARLAGGETKEQREAREQRALYQRNSGVLGLPALDSEVTIGREVYLVRGMKRAAKNNILLERKKDGKIFCGPHTQLPRISKAPTLALADFVKAVNAMQQAEVDRLNAEPGLLFGAVFHPYSEIMLASYHADGLSPQQTLDSIAAEAEAELEFESKAS